MQSRLMSLVEAVANVAIGFSVAMLTQIIVFPWFGIDADFGTHLGISACFTAVSIVRSYLVRRVFNGLSVHRSA
ncbi:DUF7220 family protein [Celeribacter halophilus]|uniref:Uncharacterized protein n=1 Tax=Celeribacter halophilus TaxID=576117 RepID=A0A1I3X1A1_9RHOB|nr:hypothetical protein [Celeribacter halophilus]PZX03198.1 hypothetical protein LX82_03778 [Celeribacter halophilus]SFK12581.1 hypothetical protein SAMN04488138_13417 [Celeribacter halophilus]